MAQTIVTLCDMCLLHDDGRESPGAGTWTITIAAPGAKAAPYAIDVCEDHGKPYRVLLEHLAEDGRRADKPRPVPAGVPRASATDGPDPRTIPAPDGLPCPAPDCDHVAATVAGLRTHAKALHGRTVAELDGTADMACPVTDCPRLFTALQGLSVHLRSQHGMTTDEARAAVAESGRG